jgi:hypothetical protein
MSRILVKGWYQESSSPRVSEEERGVDIVKPPALQEVWIAVIVKEGMKA